MEMVISNDDRVAMAEVDYIIHHMNERYLNKIPQKVQDYIVILKKRNINIYVDPHKPLENQGLKEFTLYFLMILNLKYWCNDERRKEILLMLEDNQKKYENKINNIFETAESIQGSNDIISSTKPLNKSNQVIASDVPVSQNKTEKLPSDEKNRNDAFEDFKNETSDALAKAENENAFFRFLNRIKSFFNKNKNKK